MSDPESTSSVRSTARSAPSASALANTRWADSGPMQTATISSTSAPPSRSRTASSRACTSNGFSSESPERSSRLVEGSSRRAAVALGTSLTQTAIFKGVLSLRYLPTNVGSRFSTNACRPSRASSVENMSEYRSASCTRLPPMSPCSDRFVASLA